MHRILQPKAWMAPKGYTNGLVASGAELVFVGGQIGWNEQCLFESEDFVDQTAQALRNVVTVLQEANCDPSNIVRMTWYITDKAAYVAKQKEIGLVYREIIGRHFPPMSVVVVAALIEDQAKVEVEVTAVK